MEQRDGGRGLWRYETAHIHVGINDTQGSPGLLFSFDACDLSELRAERVIGQEAKTTLR